jgi:hypothetical protein
MQSRQKSYTNHRRTELSFEVGDFVYLKVYGGFSNVSCGAKELGACGIPETLYGSEDGLKVLKIFTKPSTSM